MDVGQVGHTVGSVLVLLHTGVYIGQDVSYSTNKKEGKDWQVQSK